MRLLLADAETLDVIDHELLHTFVEHPAIVIAIERGEDAASIPLVDSATMRTVLALCRAPLQHEPPALPSFVESSLPSKAEYKRWCKAQTCGGELLRALSPDELLKAAAAANYLSSAPLLEFVCEFLRREILALLKADQSSAETVSSLRSRLGVAPDLSRLDEEHALVEDLYTPPAVEPEAAGPSSAPSPQAPSASSAPERTVSSSAPAAAAASAPDAQAPAVTRPASFAAGLAIDVANEGEAAERTDGGAATPPPPPPTRSFSSRLGGRDVLDALLMPFGPGVLRVLKGVSGSWREAARRVLCSAQWQRERLHFDRVETKVKGHTFVTESRYEIKKVVDQGAYGVTCSAHDRLQDVPPTAAGDPPLPSSQRGRVCIRKSVDFFEDAMWFRRELRELRLLRHFDGHDHLVRLRDVIRPPPGPLEQWRDAYFVFDAADTDLHYIIHSRQPISVEHVQYFGYQLLLALQALHGARVVVNGLKPRALGIDRDCTLRLLPGSFGYHQRTDGDGRVRVWETPDFSASADSYDYYTTRPYAPPEQLVENAAFSTGVDMWSAGCILAELLGRRTLLLGRDYLQQLRMILELCGPPSAEDLATVENPQAVEYIQGVVSAPSFPGREGTQRSRLEQRLPDAPDAALDLLCELLAFRADRRISADRALEHPFFAALREQDDDLPYAKYEALAAAPPADEERWATDAGRRESVYGLVKEFHAKVWPREWMSRLEAERAA